MISVQVGDEQVIQSETSAEAHHLTLGALTAVEEEEGPLPLKRDRTHISSYSGPRGRGAKEGNSNHGVPVSAARDPDEREVGP